MSTGSAEAPGCFPLIEVAGTAYELGYQHGSQAAPLVRGYLRWIEQLAGEGRAALRERALAYLPALQRYNQHFVSEVEGLADGAGISLADALLCQVRSEVTHGNQGGCTAFALGGGATADGLPLAGQNQDLEPEFAAFGILLRVRPSDGRPAALMFTFAGQLGYAGLNAAGLALFHNALYGGRPGAGVPRQALKRGLLEQRDVAAAGEHLARWPASLPGNVVLCDAAGAVADVELAAGTLATCLPEPPGACLHTNHYLAGPFLACETGRVPDSPARLAHLRNWVTAHWSRITVDLLKELLADHAGDPAGICRHGANGWHSIAGYIAEPARGLLHVRRGYGCSGTWTAYPVN